jgi:hypothetical protein
VRRTAIKLLDLCAEPKLAEAAVNRRLGIQGRGCRGPDF